jgi:hypothetical protein
MSSSMFLTSDNIEMLWDIIYDDIKRNIRTSEEESHAKQFFLKQSQQYYQVEVIQTKSSIDLININKNFISQIIQSFNGLQSTNKVRKEEMVRREDYQVERLSHFEKTLAEKQDEFKNIFAANIPTQPNFSEPLDKPLGDSMTLLISETLAKRNFDIEQINRLHPPPPTPPPTNKPITPSSPGERYNYKHQEIPKLIKIGEEIDVKEDVMKKSISWGENVAYRHVDGDSVTIKEVSNPIFSKLKKITQRDLIQEDENDFNFRLNTMNGKLDFLTEKINKIMELMEQKERGVEEKVE